MARGGSRPGAGRKRGGQCQKTQARLAIINRLGEGDMTPLDVMLAAMKDAVTRGDMAAAAGFAKDAAPYVHPRLQAILHTPRDVPGDNPLARVMEHINNRTRGRLPSDFLPVIQPRHNEAEASKNG